VSVVQALDCRICDAELPEPFLDLGDQPPANNLTTTFAKAREAATYPLALAKCGQCHGVQLTHTVDPKLLFENYLYKSGASRALREHFAALAEELTQGRAPGTVVDVGSNDGILLDSFAVQGWKTVGVEPAKALAEASREAGHAVYDEFFDSGLACSIVEDWGQVDLITANNVFAHTGDLNEFLEGVETLLVDGGRFVFEVAHLPVMLRDGTFDLVYHEHIFCHSLTTLSFLLEKHGMTVLDADLVSTHGGSLRVVATSDDEAPMSERAKAILRDERMNGVFNKPAYDSFVARAHRVRTELRDEIAKHLKAGRKVVGFTCPAKAATLTNFCGLTREHIAYIVDDNELKQGRYLPGSGIPVVGSERFVEEPPDVVIVFAWNLPFANIKDSLPPGAITIYPMPELRVVATPA